MLHNKRSGLSLRTFSWRSGTVGVAFAVAALPMMVAVSSAVDYANMVHYRADLQNIVDEAAVAGASAFLNNSTASQSAAQAVATNYFYASYNALGSSAPTPQIQVTVNPSGTMNAASGSQTALTVSVTASLTTTDLLSGFVKQSNVITATGTAGQPIISTQFGFSNMGSSACDLNVAYLYSVPTNTAGNGYDYSKVPAFSVATSASNQGNYYYIASNNTSLAPTPTGQKLPTISANQPLGFMLQNITNGNVSGSGSTCGAPVAGANSYSAPSGGAQAFYSSLLLPNKDKSYSGAPPSQNTNYSYTTTITSHSGNITAVSTTLPASTWYPNGTTVPETLVSGYTTLNSPNSMAMYLGYTYNNDCSVQNSTFKNGNLYTTYACTTQYFTASSNSAPNCSVYIQTGVTQAQINALSSGSTPSAAQSKCFAVNGTNSTYAAPTCAQLSGLSNVTKGILPAAIIWWDDAGGVGPGEQYYGPASHCNSTTYGSPGYGEDCEYKNNFFVMQCIPGNAGSLTEVALTQ